jgi:hypothetical protein
MASVTYYVALPFNRSEDGARQPARLRGYEPNKKLIISMKQS